MRPEDDFLLACIRLNSTGETPSSIPHLSKNASLRWDIILKTAELHGITPLLYRTIEAAGIDLFNMPASIRDQLVRAYFRNSALKMGVKKHLIDVFGKLDQMSVDIMLVKGIALDFLIESYAELAFHDADLILKSKKGPLTPSKKEEIEAQFHALRGIEYDFYEHHDLTMNGSLPLDFEAIWARARVLTIQGVQALVMAPEDMLLAACINSCRKRFFRLKSLLDIVTIIETNKTIDWQSLVTIARAYRCHRIVYSALFVADMLVGVDLPDRRILFDDLGVGSTRRRAIDGLSRFLRDHYDLAALHPYTQASTTLLGRHINLSLALPYLCFDGRSMLARAGYVLTTRGKRERNPR